MDAVFWSVLNALVDGHDFTSLLLVYTQLHEPTVFQVFTIHSSIRKAGNCWHELTHDRVINLGGTREAYSTGR
jgi:hypothetical protein